MAKTTIGSGAAAELEAGGTVPEVLSILPLRDTVLFPQAVIPLAAGRETSVRLIEDAARGGRLIGVFGQRDPSVEDPQQGDLYRVGTAATILKVVKQPDGIVRLVVQGIARVRIVEMVQTRPFLTARVKVVEETLPAAGDLETEALMRNAVTLFRQIVELSPFLPDEMTGAVQHVSEPGRAADIIAASLPALSTQVKQELLETVAVKARLGRLAACLTKEVEVLTLGSKIQSQVESEVGKTQREYYLREQMKAIQKELGETDERSQEIGELRQKIEAAGMTEEARKEALRELDRLAKMPPAAAEYTVARTYLEWLVALPWAKETEDNLDLATARAILDEDHWALEKVKDRILEYLAVKSMRPAGKDPILCFVGPPGVGKTSLGRSIARALGRKFHRISLGGMRDEAEIRGHRRTYIGALPGQIIQGLRRAESRNPVFMLDEIDKLGMDFRGDPASALLEVLDPEQNVAFRDHYIDVAFDLTKALFITTANILDPVPPALRDRMEVIEIAGYTEEEKVHIARKHLIPKQTADHGLVEGEHIRWTDEALRLLIRGYTREAGLRNLEREIAAITRKVAKRRVEGHSDAVEVTEALVGELLGAPRFLFEELEERTRVPGVAVGLAWTAAGGDILFIEATRMRGSKALTLTGQLGDVMKESAQAALSWVRSHATEIGIRPDFWEHSDIHVHIPAGAIPKDGPSAGVTLLTALVSLLTRRPLRPRLAMTGEVTLSGRVLPVGGIKEKVLAARRAGVTTLILPSRNEKNLVEDVPAQARAGMTFHLVDCVDQVLALALDPAPVPAEPVHRELLASHN
ncbi:MAG: endopeptidase La [Candidatus Rokubacteria bacterium GWC2_70_24]|nr:MAG: endopeptidase La [Candidatus Rokubacteria bacterium GWA2_70_23]OGK87946.1 MAG: endopeptidase La [Candidatus Rokubacteria bacterium GWC2_70_24]